MPRTTHVLTLVILVTTLLTTVNAAEQKAGVQQTVGVEIDRGQKTITEKTQLYCMQKQLEFCSKDTGIIDVIIIQLGLEDMFTEKNSDKTSVQTVG